MPKLTPRDAVFSALAHPTRVEVLRRAAQGPVNPKELAAAMNEPLGNVSYHVRSLAEAGLLVLARTEPRRGALAHFYVVPGDAKAALKRATKDIAKLADSL